jgi:hypothetical protein
MLTKKKKKTEQTEKWDRSLVCNLIHNLYLHNM